MVEKTKIGELEVWQEPDTGFTCFVHVGVIDAAAAQQVLDTFTRLAGESGSRDVTFLLCDATKAKGYTSDARKTFAKSAKADHRTYSSIFGVSFVVKTVISLLMKTVALLSTTKATVYFAENEAAARSWLAAQRRAHGARSAR
jgi:hypothetical protein